MKLIVLAVLGFVSCQSPIPKIEPEVVPTPLPARDSCDRACERMEKLQCEEAKETEGGASCVEVCEQAQASGILDLNPECRASKDSCAAMEECNVR